MEGRKSEFLIFQNWDKPARGDNDNRNIGPPGLLGVGHTVNNLAP
jgi:hypothetical protein